MRRRMIFKFGLTVIIVIAVCMFYLIHQQNDELSPEQPSENDSIVGNQSGRTEEISAEEKLRKAELEKKAKRWRESIHLSIVVCGDRGNESIILIKSAILFTKMYIIVHIFAEDDLHSSLQQQLTSWPSKAKTKFEYHLYGITFPDSNNEWKKLFKPCASQRLFIPSLLTNVDSVLYVDTDILFLSPLEEIWFHFTRFNSTQLVALAPESEDRQTGWYNRFARHPYFGELGVNSGVMLMNLTRLRNSTWLPSIVNYYKEYKLKITWGDQDLINIYFHFHPDELYVYPCEWNYRPDHCMYMSVCRGAERSGAYVLHGNRRAMQNDKQPAFKAAYSAFKEYDFHQKMKTFLLPPLQEKLEATAKTPCGRVRHIFSTRVAQFVNHAEK
ncbi:glucoside xylosyltransferase 2-like [Saccostrea echinata]|uniref:glucoside xylosyltransferase 2-like n=1 Tax=Saccostrea echinata TaxID=191078 RepID=UPI002A8175D8|nr:glucoside xylosyltransferase 2-like [Saccostrea echinata]